MKKICLLGSTGSVGRQCLEVAEKIPEVKISSIVAHSNLKLFLKQIEKFKPENFSLTLNEAREKLSKKYGKLIKSAEEIISEGKFDILFAAASGSFSLKLILLALKQGKTVAVANKEPIVMAGDILVKEALKSRGQIIPVDSEHSAIFRLLKNRPAPEKIYITSSGGAMRKAGEKRKITPEFILRHPVWNMGEKITVDSSTGVNKGFEVIEAKHLFGLPLKKISVLLHPQAIIHAIAEWADGSSLAFASPPDMKIPIAYALTGEKKLLKMAPVDFGNLFLTFENFPEDKFPGFALCKKAIQKGGIFPAVVCGADEVAVSAFLKGKLAFEKIPVIIEKCLSKAPRFRYNLDEIMEAENWAKEFAARIIKNAW